MCTPETCNIVCQFYLNKKDNTLSKCEHVHDISYISSFFVETNEKLKLWEEREGINANYWLFIIEGFIIIFLMQDYLISTTA